MQIYFHPETKKSLKKATLQNQVCSVINRSAVKSQHQDSHLARNLHCRYQNRINVKIHCGNPRNPLMIINGINFSGNW